MGSQFPKASELVSGRAGAELRDQPPPTSHSAAAIAASAWSLV